MRFSKTRNVKSPCYGTAGSAGIDFFVPEDFGPIIVPPNTDVLIPSGIKVEIPEGYMLMGADKSGVVTSKIALKRAGLTPKPNPDRSEGTILVIGAKIIDSDYQGEIHIHIINVGMGAVTIRPGMKLAQFILVPYDYALLEEVPESELFSVNSERGAGMAGSTGVY